MTRAANTNTQGDLGAAALKESYRFQCPQARGISVAGSSGTPPITGVLAVPVPVHAKPMGRMEYPSRPCGTYLFRLQPL
jgi:hypothetical protein